MRLRNGDVIPSFLSAETTPSYSPGVYFNNFGLAKGEIVRVIYPDDDQSVSKKFMEYNVYVENRRNGTGNTELIENCPFWNLLASGLDHETEVLRASDEQPWSKDSPIGNGSKVLVLFLHGESSKPVILGGIRDINDKYDPGDLKKEAGRYWLRVFNGLSTLIDQNGAFTITFNGATKSNGDLDTDKVEESAVGTTFSVTKEGNVKAATKDDVQFQEINHKDGKINHKADKGYDIEVNNGDITTNSNKFKINNASDAVILGDTYRRSEKQMHNKMGTALQTIQNLAITAGAQLSAAGTAAVGPLAALAPGLNGAAGAIQAMVAQIANLKAAIDSFEAQGKQYLSEVTFTE